MIPEWEEGDTCHGEITTIGDDDTNTKKFIQHSLYHDDDENTKSQSTVGNSGGPAKKSQLIHAECIEYMKTLPAGSCDLLVTDPPYMLPARHSIGRRMIQRTESDDMLLITFFRNIFREIDRVTSNSSAWYVFCDSRSYPSLYYAMRPYLHDLRVLVWDKTACKLGYTWRHQHELILFGYKSEFKKINTGDGDVIKCKNVPQAGRFHQAQKPVGLLKKIIAKHGKGNMVLDPFCGSGSTGVAAMETGNHFCMIEMEKSYYDFAISRCCDGLKETSLPGLPPMKTRAKKKLSS